MAERIQRRRTKGWRMPPDVVYVGRPTKWGNPYARSTKVPKAAVALYRNYLRSHPELVEAARLELRGKDLVCWCPPDQPCHTDVLLEVANEPA